MLIHKTVLKVPRKQGFFVIHNVPCNSFYYFSTKSSRMSLQTTGCNSMHRDTKRKHGDNSDDHKEKHILSYYRKTPVPFFPPAQFSGTPVPFFPPPPPPNFLCKDHAIQSDVSPSHTIQNS
jgi:hypothetical protein